MKPDNLDGLIHAARMDSIYLNRTLQDNDGFGAAFLMPDTPILLEMTQVHSWLMESEW